MSLGWKLVLQVVVPLFIFGVMLFVPAGTLRYWEAWAFLGVWFIPGLFFCIYFYRRDPALVRRRLHTKEKIEAQKWIMRTVFVILFIAFLIPGLDFRLGWTNRWVGSVPLWLKIASLVVVETCYLLVIWVLDVNRYAARTIQVEAEQQVVSTGPYKWIRHPMYFGSVVMFLFVPLALGSYVALPVFALVLPIYVLRLLNEEKVLRHELPGYPEYCEATPYRLVPYLW